MKTPEELMRHYGMRMLHEQDYAAIQADARQGMVPVEKVEDLSELLRYVVWQRLPLGDQVFDHLPQHYQEKVIIAIGVATNKELGL